ncbi:hypothetical protein [Flavobacterium sp.]|uniref:hypothetical protein n=1 Tax=Flavobacterium sp. TaxID=239 RepID=UPI0025BD6165|nr:hypothetical protein [Flavobacterium sp.]
MTAVGTVGAVIIGMHAINRNDKNAKNQIVTNKLEELLELIKTLGKNYVTLKILHNDIINLRNPEFRELQTIAQYYEIRDSKLPLNERENLFNMLSRIEVLAKCYTSKKTKDSILKYEDLMYTMTELATTTASISETLNWNDGFPTYEEFYGMLTNIEKKLIKKITGKK